MKNITIAGRLTKDAEFRRTQNGEPVLGFAVAVDDGYGERKSTLFFDCSLWGKRGEALTPHLKKGGSVTVSGDLGRREHDGKTYLTVRANEITLQGGKQERAAEIKRGYQGKQQSMYGREPDDGDARGGSAAALDDEIPFAPEWR